jgi:hypothetical protein
MPPTLSFGACSCTDAHPLVSKTVAPPSRLSTVRFTLARGGPHAPIHNICRLLWPARAWTTFPLSLSKVAAPSYPRELRRHRHASLDPHCRCSNPQAQGWLSPLCASPMNRAAGCSSHIVAAQALQRESPLGDGRQRTNNGLRKSKKEKAYYRQFVQCITYNP